MKKFLTFFTEPYIFGFPVIYHMRKEKTSSEL